MSSLSSFLVLKIYFERTKINLQAEKYHKNMVLKINLQSVGVLEKGKLEEVSTSSKLILNEIII